MRKIIAVMAVLVLSGCTNQPRHRCNLSSYTASVNAPGLHFNMSDFGGVGGCEPSHGNKWDTFWRHYQDKQPVYYYVEQLPSGTAKLGSNIKGVRVEPDYAALVNAYDGNNMTAVPIEPLPGVKFPPKGTICDLNRTIYDRNGKVVKAYFCSLPTGAPILDFKSYRERQQRRGSQNTKR